MNIFKKIKSWPDRNKKIFLWIVGIILFLILSVFWFMLAHERLTNFSQEILQLKTNWPKLTAPEELSSSTRELFQEFEKISEKNFPQNLELENINKE